MALAVSSQQDRASLQSAEGAKGLAVKVVTQLEQGLATYQRDRHSLDPECLQSLEPDLDALIRVAERMVESLKSQSDQYNEMVNTALVAIGECRKAIAEVQNHLSVVASQLAQETISETLDHCKLEELQREINENKRKLAEIAGHTEDLKSWFWVPFYNYYLAYQSLNDVCSNTAATLDQRLQQESRELQSTEQSLERHRNLHEELTRETSALQTRISDLERAKNVYDERKKLYDARFVAVQDVILYYRSLRDAVKNIEDNLDLPRSLIEKLNRRQEVLLHNGDVHQGTLKDALIQLGEDYDNYYERERQVLDVDAAITELGWESH